MDKLCLFCEKQIPKDKKQNKFCGHSCSASYNNKGVVRNIKDGSRKKKPCSECGTITSNAKFCSRICTNEDRKKKVEATIKSGQYKVISSGDTFLRRYLIRTRGHKCEGCGTEKWLKQPIPLDLHHKNGDNQDNELNNVILLCLNCHGLTPNFGRKNKKKK